MARNSTRTASDTSARRLQSDPGTSKRDAIVRAARALVARVGFREAQMVAIAEEAGLALGTLYRYFPRKADLMIEVVSQASQREVDIAAGIAMGEGSATERLALAAWTFASRALRGRRLAHALVAEPVDPEIEAARLKCHRALARVFETIIEQGIRDGDFPRQDVHAGASCVVGSIFEGLVKPLAAGVMATEAERHSHATAIVGFCMRGVSGKPLTFKDFKLS
jgi:AcrR family transcriptional regulator